MKAKFVITTIILYLIIFVTGCADKNDTEYIYKGESEHWTAKYTITVLPRSDKTSSISQGDDRCEAEIIVVYKMNLADLSNAKHLKYSVMRDGLTGYEDIELGPEEKRKEFSFKSNVSEKRKNFDDPVTLTIDLDGQIETFDLTLH